MPTPVTSVVVNQLLMDAFLGIRFGRAGDSLEPELMAWGLRVMNEMFDAWNADPDAKFDLGFASYVPIANQQEYSLGPSAADWTVTHRPDRIKGANLILAGSTPAVRTRIEIRDDEWWLSNAVQGMTSAIVTDLYYAPSFPNGTVTLFPKPTTAVNLVELMTDGVFSQYAMTDTLWLPFGYRQAAKLTLSELLAPGCGQTVSAELREQAANARVIVFGNNVQTRNIRTRDGGMPGGGRRRGGFLYRTGRIQ